MDGKIVIGTSLDTKQLEKQLKEQERELQRYEKEAEKLTDTKAKLEVDVTEFKKGQQEARNEVKKLEYQLDKAKERLKEIQSIDNVHLTMPEYTSMMQEETNVNWQIAQLEDKLKNVDRSYENIPPKIQKQIDQLDEVNEKLKQNAINQGLVGEEINKTSQDLQKAKGFSSISEAIKNIGKDTEKNIKKVGKWTLAIFGLRAVYNMVRNAITTLSQSDENLKNDIDYIKSVLAYMLEPVVRKIVEWVKLLLQYLGWIIKQWTGQDIFANADRGLKKANKQAKELKKQLAGFDEANVLSDNKSKDDSGLGGNIKPIQDGEVPKWLQFIKDHGKEIISLIVGIAVALKLLGMGFTTLQSIGIGLAIAGITYAIMSLIDYLNDPSFENFGKIIIGIGVAVVGIGIAIGALPVIIGGAIVVIVGLFIAFWDDIKSLWQSGIDWLSGLGDWIGEHLGEDARAIWTNLVGLMQGALDYVDGFINAIKKVFDGVIEFFTGVFTGDWKKAWDGIKKIFGGVWDFFTNTIKYFWNTFTRLFQNAIGGFYAVINGIKSVFKGVVNWIIDGLNKLIDGLNKLHIDKPDWLGGGSWGINIPRIPKLATGGIVNMPSRGVMVGSAIAGESGREGVIPLTDPNAMALLGREIGQWVNLAIDNRMVVDGRVLATATNNQINKESFLMNR